MEVEQIGAAHAFDGEIGQHQYLEIGGLGLQPVEELAVKDADRGKEIGILGNRRENPR